MMSCASRLSGYNSNFVPGVSKKQKESTYQQPALDEPERGWQEAEAAIDRAILKFGPKAVQRARLTASGRALGRSSVA